MFKYLYIFVFISTVSGLSCKEPQKSRELIPIEDFFRNPEKTYLQISPDGNYIAYLQPYENRLNIFVQEIRSKEITRLTSETARSIRKFFWVNNNQLLYLKDKDGDEFYHLYSVTKDGNNTVDLTPFENVKMKFIDNLENSDDEILIAFNKRKEEVFDLYRLNIKSGNLKMIAENPGNISYWRSDHNGKIRLAVETDGVNESILFREDETKPFQKVITLNFKETLYPIAFTPDNKNIYAISNIGRDKSAVVEFDLKTATEKRIIFSHPDVDVTEMSYSRKTKEPLYCGYTTWKYEIKYLTEGAQKLNDKIQRLLAEEDFYIVSLNDDENKFLVRTSSDKSLGTYYLYESNTDELIKISEVSPWIDENKMADIKPISFKSRDGITLHGYLTLPPGEITKNLPVIVYPHGGPWIRNRWGYQSETQFFANRGYAVLQVNYRGSQGYGKLFLQSGFKEIGRKMQEDITDGVNWLINEGYADTARIGIYGFSFGGYFALNGAIKTPELYKCAVSYCGVTNLFSYIKNIPPYYKPYLQMTYEMIGNPEKDADYFREYSPVFHTDKINIPLLIAQGAKDSRVSPDEVGLFVKTLKKQKKNVNYFYLENEGHGFSNTENKVAFFTEVERFFGEHIPSNK